MIPCGVADTKQGRPMLMRPTLMGWKPSTSLLGLTASMMRCSLMCFGRGELDDEAMHLGVVIQALDLAEQTLFCDVILEADQ